MPNSIKILLLCLILIFTLSIVVLAQEASPEVIEAVNLDEDVQPEDLEVGTPTILPGHPLYFLKNWGRSIRLFFAFRSVTKAKLISKFANEKLMEAKKLIEKRRDPEIIKRGIENYQEEIEGIKTRVERIKETAKENPQVESFLDKFLHQQTLHQKLLSRLENQVPTEAFEKIKEARERHLERFKDVMLKLEDRKEKITEKLDETLEEQRGSKYKHFKNLEVLLKLEEKVPEDAKEAIRRAQENSLKRLKGDLERMSPEDHERFKEYLDRIAGEREIHLEILENLELEISEIPETPNIIRLRERLEEGKTNILENIEKKLEGLNCPSWIHPEPGFCKKGRVIVERDPKTDCPLPPKCIIPGEIICEIFITCEEGYVPYDTGYKDSWGCSIKKCTKKEGEAETKPIIACIALWDPICGVDGRTYSNECYAKVASVEIDYKGVCKGMQHPSQEIP